MFEFPNLLNIIRESVRNVPALKYAFGVLGLLAVVAAVPAMQLDYRIALVGTIVVVLLAALVLVFSKLSVLDRGHFRLPALVLVWFTIILTMAVPTLLITSVFFKQPVDLSKLLTNGNGPDPTLPPDRKKPEIAPPIRQF